ncbi:MAG: hypothetical protein ACO3C1_11240 [Ilumatobacteraceae bacterium]
MTTTDPRSLSLADLRALRTELQQQDDVVSYVRRLAQVRLDLVRAARARRSGGAEPSGDITGDLSSILSSHLVGGAARPPRPADDFSDHPLALELEVLCRDAGGNDVDALDDAELAEYEQRLSAWESARSSERKELFGRIDALSAELVRRYRDGEADPTGLLADD